MATTDSDAPLPPAEAVAVFDRFKANLARLSTQNKEQLQEQQEQLDALQAEARAKLPGRKVEPKPAT